MLAILVRQGFARGPETGTSFNRDAQLAPVHDPVSILDNCRLSLSETRPLTIRSTCLPPLCTRVRLQRAHGSSLGIDLPTHDFLADDAHRHVLASDWAAEDLVWCAEAVAASLAQGHCRAGCWSR